jgi:hypothetical protein
MIDRFALEDESSMLVWYPKVEGKIPTPFTRMLELSQEDRSSLYGLLDGKPLDNVLEFKIKTVADLMGTPFFLRTDQASGKHEWKDTCYVTDKTKIIRHLARIIEFHACADIMGLRYAALAFREYLPLQSTFTAFNDMPVAPEWRYFVRDGKPVCKHFYWVADAIIKPSRKDWKIFHKKMQILSKDDNNLLKHYATIFAKNNPGYWSVDFALTRDKGWVLIDAARGEISWHPAKCIDNPNREELLKEKNKQKPNFDEMFVKIDTKRKP